MFAGTRIENGDAAVIEFALEYQAVYARAYLRYRLYGPSPFFRGAQIRQQRLPEIAARAYVCVYARPVVEPVHPLKQAHPGLLSEPQAVECLVSGVYPGHTEGITTPVEQMPVLRRRKGPQMR